MEEGIVNSIEVSHHQPGKAYAVVMRYKFMDLKPYIYKTDDYGASWKSISEGIQGAFQLNRYLKSLGAFPKASSGYSLMALPDWVERCQRSIIP